MSADLDWDDTPVQYIKLIHDEIQYFHLLHYF